MLLFFSNSQLLQYSYHLKRNKNLDESTIEFKNAYPNDGQLNELLIVIITYMVICK